MIAGMFGGAEEFCPGRQHSPGAKDRSKTGFCYLSGRPARLLTALQLTPDAPSAGSRVSADTDIRLSRGLPPRGRFRCIRVLAGRRAFFVAVHPGLRVKFKGFESPLHRPTRVTRSSKITAIWKNGLYCSRTPQGSVTVPPCPKGTK